MSANDEQNEIVEIDETAIVPCPAPAHRVGVSIGVTQDDRLKRFVKFHKNRMRGGGWERASSYFVLPAGPREAAKVLRRLADLLEALE